MTTTTPLLPRHDLPGLHNFAQISPTLYRGSQPTAEGMRTLEQMGIRTILNLRAYHSDREELRGTNLNYVHLHCRAWLPRTRQIAAALTLITTPNAAPVFVHCQHGADRTGVIVAVYRMLIQNWNHAPAAAELVRFGHHKIFRRMRRYLAAFDLAKMRAAMADAKLSIKKRK